MRWLIRIFFSLVLLVALLIGGVFLLPADKIAALASDQLRKATGREVTLSGRLKPSIWPQIGVATGPVTVSNAEWASDTPMVQAEGLSIGLDLKALIAGEIKLRNVEALRPRILLERARDGRVNWQFGNAEAAQTTGTTPAPAQTSTPTSGFTLDRAVISDGSVTFVDSMADSTQTVTNLDATLTLPDYNGPADLALSASVNGQPMQAKLTLGVFSAFIAGQVAPVVADISAGASRIQFNGRAGTAPLAATGTLDADVSDLAALSRLTGAPPPDLPAGVSGKIALAGQMTYAPEGSVHLRGGKITVGGNVLSGAADLYLAGTRPKLNAQLSTGTLNLAPFLGGSGTGPGGAGDGGGGNTSAPGWSKNPIDVSALGTLDAEVALSAESIDLGTAKFGKTRALATLTDRRLVLDLRELRGYDGLLTGNVVLNGRGGLSMGGDLNAAGIGMLALLSDLADYKRLSTSADFSLKFLASGNSMDALMHSLSGSGALNLGQGELLGVDLARTFRRPTEGADVNSDARTIFNSVAATYTIAGGVLSNTDLAMLSPRVTLAGRGTVGIGEQTLDYNITPTAFASEDGTGGVKVPLKIAGTWAKPKFSLDLDELAKQRTEAKRKKLESEVRSNVERELGVTEGSGESLEDAAKRKLREEAARGLKNLFKK